MLSFKSSNTLFNDLIKIQIYNSKKEQDLKKTIKTNKVVEDEVSQKVRKQYEENPYPRWRYIYKNNKINFLIRLQNQIKPNIVKVFTDLINNSGFKGVSFKNIDFEKLYNSRIN